jgi:hypothetical protein
MSVISPGPLMIVRVPWPMPRWRTIMQAMTGVMRSHRLRQKDIHALDGMAAVDPVDRNDHDRELIARLEEAYNGSADRFPRFWLYQWSGFKGGSFRLARPPVEIS